ncbi:hypothetical protein OTB20_00250 [Streptomyces sp. H27-H1]|uniref:MerR family transcriptional regulator n=1 Tax=Streptomyces sp. H27-H1 TaxID=2996461 RepID=UPI0022707614|nr:MerR family transcriptional regulator [Streptomyces sp. H27-H1]MCY0924675.1 hypothetical protein [Streptomyces sp. H27-H1]
MQLPELSAEIRIPVRALQLYIRMGLLPALPVYDESHVRRAVLVRTLLDVGGLSYSARPGWPCPCAGRILGRRLMHEVHTGSVLGDPALLPDRGRGWDPLAASRGTR